MITDIRMARTQRVISPGAQGCSHGGGLRVTATRLVKPYLLRITETCVTCRRRVSTDVLLLIEEDTRLP